MSHDLIYLTLGFDWHVPSRANLVAIKCYILKCIHQPITRTLGYSHVLIFNVSLVTWNKFSLIIHMLLVALLLSLQ